MSATLDWSEESQDPILPALLNAAEHKRYPTLYALLDKLHGPLLSEEDCRALLLAGLNCSIRAFRAILEHCPSAAELTYPDDPFSCNLFDPFDTLFASPDVTLADKAARGDRPEHLDELLRRGCSPNGASVLLSAFLGKSPRCVKRLIREPDLDLFFSPDLLDLWAKTGMKGEEKLDECCLAAAPRLLQGEASQGKLLLYRGVPIPSRLDLNTVLLALNFPLAEFLCRNREVTLRAGMAAMEALGVLVSRLSLQRGPHCFSWKSRARNISRQQLISALNALLTACPQLLRRRLPQTLLFFTALSGKAVPPTLRPWLEQLHGGKVALDPAPGLTNLAHALLLWEERFGSRWTPTLDPRAVSWSFFSFDHNTPIYPGLGLTALEVLLSRCRIRRFSPGEKLTYLSQAVLRVAPIPLVLCHLQPGGLLAGEDPKVLQDFCLSTRDDLLWEAIGLSPALHTPLTPQRRQAVLVHIKTEVDYEL